MKTSVNHQKLWVTPARLKILSAVILLIAFAVILDFTMPVEGIKLEPTDDQVYAQLDYLAELVKNYYEINDQLPPFIKGGDRQGMTIALNSNSQNHKYDSIIDAGIINSYPEIHHHNLKSRKLLLLYKRLDRNSLFLFGSTGNIICNIAYLNDEILRDLLKNYPDSNPFNGCFEYHINDDNIEFTISVVKRFHKHFDNNDLFYVFSVLKCTLIDGIWVSDYSETQRKL